MLGKLIKHEFRAMRRPFIPLFISTLGVALLAAIALFAAMELAKTAGSHEMNAVFIMMTSSITIICAIALASATIVALILIAQRFYNSVIKNEAYLTFTLPVTPNQILMSKTITSYIYSIITYVLMGFGLFLIVMIGIVMPFGRYFDSSIFYQFRYYLSSVFSGTVIESLTFVVLNVLNLIISPASSILMLYFCIMAGSKIASKHKILCAVGLYLAIAIVIACVSSGISMAVNIGMQNISLSYFNITSVISLVLNVILGVLFYFFTHYFMSKNYNVE